MPKTLFSVLVVSAILHSLRSDVALAQGLNGDPDLLRLAAVEHQGNREKLRTWAATVAITSEISSGDDLLLRETTNVEFLYDKGQGTNWKWKQVWERKKKNGVEQSIPPELILFGATSLKDGATYLRTVSPSRELEMGGEVTVFSPPGNPTARAGITRDKFDPIYFYRRHNVDLAERFLSLYEGAKKKTLDHVFVQRRGSQVTMEFRVGSLLNRYVADLNCGANLIAYFGKEESAVVTGTEEWTFEYEQVEGVWVPKLITMKIASADGLKQNTRVSRWLHNEVNGAASPDQFKLQALGVEPGELVQDTRAQAIYTYGDAESAERVPLSRASRVWGIGLAFLGLVVAISVRVLASFFAGHFFFKRTHVYRRTHEPREA